MGPGSPGGPHREQSVRGRAVSNRQRCGARPFTGNRSFPNRSRPGVGEISAYRPCGDTVGAIYCYWHVVDPDPIQCQVPLADTGVSLSYEGGLLDCLIDLLTGRFAGEPLWAGRPPSPTFIPTPFDITEEPYVTLT
jgi:hypothetical protein